jgi:N-acetylneuraminate lyase
VRLIRLLASHGYMSAAKTLMGLLGVDVGPARLPNARLEPAVRQSLQESLERMGFFDWIR